MASSSRTVGKNGLITLTVKGEKEIQRALRRKIQRLESFAVPLDAIVQDFYAVERQWFDSQGGGRWQPLRPGYAAWKRRAYPGKPLMRLTDRMWKEFTGKPGHYRVRRNRLDIYIKGADYWKKHQKGSKGTYGKIPRRPILAEQLKSRQKRWHELVSNWLTAQLELTPQKLLAMNGRAKPGGLK